MPTIRMDIKNLPAYQRKLAKAFKPAVKEGLTRGGADAMKLLKLSTETARPASRNGKPGATNTLKYMRGWKMQITELALRIYNRTPYASIVEYGRRPGTRMPPVRAIVLWAKRRLGKKASEAASIAYAIAKAIARRGLKGRYVFKAVKKPIQLKVTQHVQRSLRTAWERTRP